MWRNDRDPRISGSDVWMPEFNNSESRIPSLANSDYFDERLKKIEFKEFPSVPYRDREPPNFPFQGNELNRHLWPNREPQNQSLSSRKLSRSVNGSSNNIGGFPLERSSTGPRSGPFVNREEDLYSSQEMVSIRKSNHLPQNDAYYQQKAPQLDDEPYPAMNTMRNYRRAATFDQDYGASSFALKKGLDPRRAALEGAMMNYVPSYSNPQLHNFPYEGHFTGPSDYSLHSFGGPYEHPHARFQERISEPSGDPYSRQLSSCGGAYNFPKPLHQLTGPHLAPQMEMPLVSTMNACTCCKEHTHMQPPSLQMHSSYKPHPLTQHPPLGYQHLQNPAHFQGYTTFGKFSSKSSQNSLRSLQLRRKVADPLSEAIRARKEKCPPLPGPCGPPYVLCQGCGKVIQIPTQPYYENAVLKVRCSACRRISKFCNIVHPCYQALLKQGKMISFTGKTVSSDSFNKQKLPSKAATVGEFEQNTDLQDSVSENLDDEPKPKCVVEGQLDGKNKDFEVKGTHVGVQEFDAHMPRTLGEQGPDDDGNSFRPWSRLATFHEDSSSLFSASGSVSTKNTAGLKSHESEQFETNVESFSQCTMPEECVKAKDLGVEVDPIYQQESDIGPIVSSKELQGLMLECLQESSCDDLKVKRKDAFTSEWNQSFQEKHSEPMSLSNDTNQNSASLSPREKIYHLKQNDLVRSSSYPYQTFLSPREQIGSCNLESEPDKAELSKDGANASASGPKSGSPLHEYLSYDTASEIAEAPNSGVECKQTASAPCTQETSKGSNFLTSFLKKNIHLGNAGQGNTKIVGVVVNGAVIPFDAIKSAEKQAGAIRPGVYWYDYEAGFWGVMGGPCLGIIPPFIAEFKVPLAKDCAGGTTGVFVNGRELHKKDLDALAGRGLPRTSGKSYMVDISGQVVDYSSGQMLRSLGRLAPTVQKRGRGCGMFQPPTRS